MVNLSEPEDENEKFVRLMEEVIEEDDEDGEVEPSDRQWFRAYEIACQRLIRNRINNS